MAIRVREKEYPWVLLFGFVFVTILLLAILLPLEIREKNNVEVAYSSDAEKYDKVYIDITSCEPKYAISIKGKPGSGITDIVCEVQTTDNGKMLVAISAYYYEQGEKNFEGSTLVDTISYYREGSFIPNHYPVLSFDAPYRLHCRVSDADEYGLTSDEGDKVVLELNYNNETD